MSGAQIVHLFGITLLSGAIISGISSSDKTWLQWHFSRLGEGGHISALIFNAALVIAGIMLIILGYKLKYAVTSLLKEYKLLSNHKTLLLYRMIYVVGLCLIVVGLFPFDVHPRIHNIGGYGSLVAVLILCYLSPYLLPIFSNKYIRYSHFLVAATFIIYTFYFTIHSLRLLIVEFVLFVFVYIWLLAFIKEIYNKIK
jgi:hypothetical protein